MNTPKNSITIGLVNITPKMANDWLAKTQGSIARGEFRQRKICPKFVNKTAADIANGDWTINSDLITISDRGNIINGQNRLAAIVKAGRPIAVPTMLNCPEVQSTASGKSVPTISNIDTGRMRSIGQQLNIAYNFEQGNKHAALARALAMICLDSTRAPITVAQTLDILAIYDENITAINYLTSSHIQRKSSVIAPLAFYHRSNPEVGSEFAEKLFTLDNIPTTHPAMLLDRWLRENPLKRGDDRLRYARVIFSAIAAFEQGEQITRLRDEPKSMEWAHSKQKQNVLKIRNMLTIRPIVNTGAKNGNSIFETQKKAA